MLGDDSREEHSGHEVMIGPERTSPSNKVRITSYLLIAREADHITQDSRLYPFPHLLLSTLPHSYFEIVIQEPGEWVQLMRIESDDHGPL